jgi:hypothetical protein
MAVTTLHPRYPVHVEARLDRPSRWLWLVKWILAIPHYVLLVFLWAAFVVLTAVAFVAILVNGRYPRPIFDFNVGVLRWSWRVSYYTWGALATDRYPPFTLADVPDYPARLDVDYPQRLSRGLVLVKWWLLALPHYLIAAIFVGGGTWLATDRSHDYQWGWGGGGLVGVLVCVSAVVLLVTGRYPQALFDFILGMQRWVLRVWAYAALMTDSYPPFRLDVGGPDPDGVLTIVGPPGPAPAPPATEYAAPPSVQSSATVPGPGGATSMPASAPGSTPTPSPTSGWTAGGIVGVVVGAALALTSMGLLTGGAAVAWADLTQRDAAGYVVSPSVDLDTGGYAVQSESLRFQGVGPSWLQPDGILGTVRIRVTGTEPGRSMFVGIAPTAAVDRYLAGTDHATLAGVTGGRPTYTLHRGTAPSTPAPTAGIWTAQSTGTGTVELAWKVRSGSWSVVLANTEGTPGVQARADVAATIPALGRVAVGVLVVGALLLAVAALLIAVPVAGAGRRRAAVPAATGSGPGGPTG